MTINEQKTIAKHEFPIEYQICINWRFPEKYILWACKWLKMGHPVNGIGWCLKEWEQYVGDKYDINKIKDVDDLVHTFEEYRLYGKRDISKRPCLCQQN